METQGKGLYDPEELITRELVGDLRCMACVYVRDGGVVVAVAALVLNAFSWDLVFIEH